MSGRKGSSNIGVGGGKFQTDAKAFAKDVVNEQYGLKYKREMEKDIKQFFKYSLQKDGIDINPNTGEPIVKKSVMDRANKLAEKIANNIEEKNYEAINTYNALKSELKKPVYVSKEERKHITDFDDYKKDSAKNIRITSNEKQVSLDTRYQELSRDYPHLFNASKESNTQAQLDKINSVMNNLRDSRTISARRKYGNGMVKDIRDDLIMYSSVINVDVGDYRKSRSKKK